MLPGTQFFFGLDGGNPGTKIPEFLPHGRALEDFRMDPPEQLKPFWSPGSMIELSGTGRRHKVKGGRGLAMTTTSDHHRITSAGWSYRTNGRGWVIYCDPQTRLWHTRSQALSVLDTQSAVCPPAAETGEAAPFHPNRH